jgi:rod shape-determining protein MreC
MKRFFEHPKLAAAAIAIVVLLVFVFASVQLSKTDGPMGNIAKTAVAAIQKPFASGIDALREQLARAITDESLRAENEALREEVERLQEELIENRLEGAELEELGKLQNALGTDELRAEYTLKAANVLAFEGSDTFNIFTIDVGTEAGVMRDTIVVSGAGLIGRVVETQHGSSKVVAIIDQNNNIGFQLTHNMDFLGVCRGDGDGKLAGEMLDDTARVDVGDRVITSGIGGVYPAGVVIGTVTKAEHTKESNLLTVEIEPAVYFAGIKKVALLL